MAWLRHMTLLATLTADSCIACAPATLAVSLADVHVRLYKLLTAKWLKFRYNFNELKAFLSYA